MLSKPEILELFSGVPKEQRSFVEDTIDEYVFFGSESEKLRQLPLIRVDKRDPEHQQITAAGRQIKDYSNIIDAKRKTLLKILGKYAPSEADKLREMMKEYGG